jgi:flagella basal body P-ring formation protein FlgA
MNTRYGIFGIVLGLLVLSGVFGTARGAGTGDDAARWRLRDEVRCTGPQLRLDDLVAAGATGELGARVVGTSPRPGRSGEMGRERLRRLLADWGWRGRLAGPERIRLHTPGIELAAGPLRAAVQARLDSLLEARGLARSGETEGWPRSLIFASEQLRWDLQLPEAFAGAGGRAALRLTDAAGFESRANLRFRCAKPVRVALCGAPLSTGERPVAWEWAEGDAFALEGAPLHEEELAEAVARRAVAAGEALTRGNLRPAPLVQAGREVTILLERGAVRVRRKGIARGDGALGDLVPVAQMDGRSLGRYRVRGPATVVPAYLHSDAKTEGARS